jgi:hypothetical protein
MNNKMSKNKAVIIAIAAFIGVAFVNPVRATETDPPGVEVKYLGFQQSNPVFEIVLHNHEIDNYIITIKDETGHILYAEKLKGKNLSRRYRIDTEDEIAAGTLLFEVRSVNAKKTEIYTVGVTETIKRNVAVNKIQ